jgi:Tetracyclin repressor-like, C-terminal domain
VLEAVVGNTFDALADYLRRGIEAHTDPVARLRGACHAYVAFGHEHPEQYAILFSLKIELSPEIDKTVDSMLGAEAFAFLLDAVRECAATGRSSSTQPNEDAPQCGWRCTAMSACGPRYPTILGRPTTSCSTISSTVSRC